MRWLSFCFTPAAIGETIISSARRRGGERRLIAAITPLRPADRRASLKGSLAAAIFLLEPERAVSIDAELLIESLGLTPLEAELVVLLAGGADLRRAAGQMGIGIGAARWYLKQALGKTGARHQSDLVRLAAGFALHLR
jgi:DNA-binding CsgD family transcriptional regulator